MRAQAGRWLGRAVRLASVAGVVLFPGACNNIELGPEEVVTVTIVGGDFTLVEGATVRLEAAARDENGVAFQGPTIAWSSDDVDVATVNADGLVRAIGVGTATITAMSGGKTGSVQVTVTEAPALSLSASTVVFTASAGGSDPSPQTVSITNSGGGTLDRLGLAPIAYNAGEPTGWLSATLSESPTLLTLRAAVAGLPMGTYQARVPVTASGATNSPQNVVVTLAVGESAPVIQLTPSVVSIVGIAGEPDPPDETVQVANAGGGSFADLSVGAVQYGPGQPVGWLTATLNGTTVTLSASTGALADGDYDATVPIAASNAANSPQNISVQFTVQANGSAIGLSSSNVMFDAVFGGSDPPPVDISITNIGTDVLDQLSAGPVQYGGGEPTGWLGLSLSGTTAPATLTLMASVGALAAGNYTATVPVSAPDAVNSPRLITVTFAVAGAGAPDTVRFVAGGTMGTVAAPVVPDPTVIVVDAFGNPVAGASVVFDVSGDGSVSPSVVATDGSGNASVQWTLGTAADFESDTLTAMVTGADPVLLVATARPGMPTQLSMTQQPAGAVSNVAFTTQPTIQLLDAFGNASDQSGEMVTAAIDLGGGVLQGVASVATNGNGAAVFTNLRINGEVSGIGTHRLAFSSGSLNPTTSSNFDVAASFAYNVQFVLGTTEGATPTACLAAGCHANYTSTTALVNQNTVFHPGCGVLVVPGDTLNSILYRKVRDASPPCGSQMPNGILGTGDPLSQARLDVIIAWILEGAANN